MRAYREAQRIGSMRRWKCHHPLTSEQLEYASKEATVARVGIYHGGDPIYQLVDIPGTWHEECLVRLEEE